VNRRFGDEQDTGSDLIGTTGALVKFTSPQRGGDSIATESAGKITVGGALDVTGTFNVRPGQNGEWRDLITPLRTPTSGPSIPVLTAVGSGVIRHPVWAINDQLWTDWHIQHDYALGTDVLMHMHWYTSGTSVAVVRWEFTFYHAKGNNQANFDFGGAGVVVTSQEAAHGTAYRHMITEAGPITITGLEPDSMLCTRIRRVTNGGVDNADTVFGFQADLHYQATSIGTKNRFAPFYT
jgi:hypothetical protein